MPTPSTYTGKQRGGQDAMAVNSIKFSFCCVFFVIFILNNESLASSSNSSQHNDDPLASIIGISRNKRNKCTDGDYQHEGNTCCRCAAGHRVKEHCTATSDTKCEQCEKGTYNSPNSLERCQPCTSCAHPNANLEEVEACTSARDAKCRCKESYYCSNDTEKCQICNPCQTCSSGIKQECTATSNRVCSDDSNAKASIIAGVISAAVIVLVIVAVIIWKKKKQTNRTERLNGGHNETTVEEEEMQDLRVPVVDLEPLVPEIAEKLGWTTMKDIATRSNIHKNVIHDCERNHPGHSEEQTRELLQKWVEENGRDGSKRLIKILRDMKQNNTADKILAIFEHNA